MLSTLIEKPLNAVRETSPVADVAVIISALNEEASLPLVLRALPAVRMVFVVDNGSDDETAAVAQLGGATVVHELRRGYGSACQAGIRALASLVDAGETSPAVVAFVDADFSDYPDWLPRLVSPIFDGHADFVLGSRLAGDREPGAMPPQSVYGNRLACLLMRWIWGASYTDLGPFRAISYEALRRLDMRDEGFGWTIEMQIKAVDCSLRVEEVRFRIGVGSPSAKSAGRPSARSKPAARFCSLSRDRPGKRIVAAQGRSLDDARRVAAALVEPRHPLRADRAVE